VPATWPAPPRRARQRTAAPTCHGTVIVNDRERAEDGSYRDQGAIVYSLTVFGYCATHHELAINDGPIRETCRTAANHARGICGHALCETRDTCALAV